MNRYRSSISGKNDILSCIDKYFVSMLLECDDPILRTPGWTSSRSRSETDPTTLLFGMRQVVYLLAPARRSSIRKEIAGIASLADELYSPVTQLLNLAEPQEFFRPALLSRLDRLVREKVKRPLAPGSEPRLDVFYATPWNYQPYLGQWIEWIERLDESTETDPFALALLARHSGGVFVVRHRGSIVAYIGLRAYAPDSEVWELTTPRLTGSRFANFVARPGELFTALIARATRAALEAEHIPICTVSSRESKLQRVLKETGYLLYANSSVYATVVP